MEVRSVNDGPCEQHPLLPKAMLLLPSARMLLCLVESVASCSKTITFLVTASTTAVAHSSNARQTSHSFHSDEGGDVTFSCTVCGHDASGVMAMEAYIPCSGISFRKGSSEDDGAATATDEAADRDTEEHGGDDEGGSQATYCTPGFAIPHATWLRHWETATCPTERRPRKTRSSAFAAQLPRPLQPVHRQVALASIHSSTPWKRPAPSSTAEHQGGGGIGGVGGTVVASVAASNATAPSSVVSQTADLTMACRTLSHCLKELLAAKAGIPVDELDRVVAGSGSDRRKSEEEEDDKEVDDLPHNTRAMMMDNEGGGDEEVEDDGDRGYASGGQGDAATKPDARPRGRPRKVSASTAPGAAKTAKKAASAAALLGSSDLDLDTPIRLTLTNSHIHVESTDVGDARQYRIVRFLEYQGLWTVGAVRNVLWHRMAKKEDVLGLFAAANALRTEHSDLVVKPCISTDTQRPAMTLEMNDVVHNADGTVHTSRVFTGTLDVMDWGGDVVNVGASQWGVDAPPMFRIAEEIRIDPRQFYSFVKPMIGRWRTPGYLEGGWFVSRSAADIRGDDAELFLGFHAQHPILHVLIQAPKHGVVMMALISGKEG